MALINCPECGKEVSDKSETCINCGCPINQKDNTVIIQGMKVDLTEIYNLLSRNEKIKAIKELRERTDMGLAEAKDYIEYLENQNRTSNFTPSEVKCPQCGSTQIQAVTRKWSLMTGFMTNKVDRVCMNCNCKF